MPPDAPNARPDNRRGAVRFKVMCRVDYEAGGRSRLGFTADLSASGLFIDTAAQLTVGDTVVCSITLDESEHPITVECVVRRVTGRGAALEITPGQGQAVERVRTYLESRPVQQLERFVDRGVPTSERLSQLASYYLETDRADEAFAIYRNALSKYPSKLFLYEDFAALLLDHLVANDQRSGPLVTRLQQVIDRGERAGESVSLRVTAERLAALEQGKLAVQAPEPPVEDGRDDNGAREPDPDTDDPSWGQMTVLESAVHCEEVEDDDRFTGPQAPPPATFGSRWRFSLDRIRVEAIGWRVGARANWLRFRAWRRRHPRHFYGAVGALALLVVALVVTFSGDSDDGTAEAVAGPPPDAVEPAVGELPTPEPELPPEPESADTAPSDTATADTEPTDSEAVDSPPVRPKPPRHKQRKRKPPRRKSKRGKKSLDSLFDQVD